MGWLHPAEWFLSGFENYTKTLREHVDFSHGWEYSSAINPCRWLPGERDVLLSATGAAGTQ
jgi:hypothetical protein